jgi:hypothetical protein
MSASRPVSRRDDIPAAYRNTLVGEAGRVRERPPRAMVAPLFYQIRYGRLYQVAEDAGLGVMHGH